MVFFLCQFFYPGESESYNIPLKILWGETYPKELDNPYKLQGKKKPLSYIYFNLSSISLLA